MSPISSEATLLGRSGAAGRRGGGDLHAGRAARGAGARRRQRSGRAVRSVSRRSRRAMRWSWWKRGDLAKSSGLAQAVRGSRQRRRIACYADTARDLADVVRDALSAEGLSIAPDALDDAVSRLGSDRGVTRREIEKLALYAHGQKQRDAGRCARGDGRRSRSAQRKKPATRRAAAILARLDRRWNGSGSPDISPIAGAAQRDGRISSADRRRAKVRRAAKSSTVR